MKVVFERAALLDLQRVAAWIGAESPHGAARVIARIRRSTQILSRFPRSGRPSGGQGARLLIEPKYRYRIVYVIDEDAVRILNVIHPARRRR